MRLWTFPRRDLPKPPEGSISHAKFRLAEFMEELDPTESLTFSLLAHREQLRRYELESYAAIGRKVVDGLNSNRRLVVLQADKTFYQYSRFLEVATPIMVPVGIAEQVRKQIEGDE